MTFELPINFVQDTNEISRLLDQSESASTFKEQGNKLREALVIGCRLLSNLKFENLHREIEIFYADGITSVSKIIDSSSHFDFFLENVERSILSKVGFNKQSQDRAITTLRKAKQLSDGRILSPEQVISILRDLQREVCALKNEKIQEERVFQFTVTVSRVFASTIIVADVLAPLVFPPATPAAITASVTLGGTMAAGIVAINKM